MKTLNATLLALSLSTAIIGQCALAQNAPPPPGGVSGSGGGNSFSSTPEEVASAVERLKYELNFLGLISQAQTRQLLNPDYATDPDIKNLLLKFSKNNTGLVGFSGTTLVQDAYASPLVAKAHCHHGESAGDDRRHLHSDASTEFRRGAEVCFSTERLSRHPRENLPAELAVLLMHELAHHFGANEEVANKFQNFMSPYVREFYREFPARRTKPSDERASEIYEMRPGGQVRLRTSPALNVRCLIDGEAVSTGNLAGQSFALFIRAGQSMKFRAANGIVNIGCSSLPTVRCSLRQLNGKTVIQSGDRPNDWSFLPGTISERFNTLVEANVCTPDTRTSAEQESEKAQRDVGGAQ
jgi:hypothetical protein